MRTDNKTMLEAFEETGGRGDVLSLPLSYLKRMQAVPFERFAPIIYQLFKWFVTGDNTPLDDPLANAELEGLKVEQLQNAVRRKAFLVAQAERSERGVAARKKKQEAKTIPRNTVDNPRVTHGLPDGNPTITKTVTVNRNPNQSEGYGFTGDVSGVDADATPDTSLTATVLTEAEARQTIAAFAPPATEEIYGKEFVEAEERSGIGGKFVELEQFSCDFILSRIDEKGNALTRNALLKFRREVGADVLWRAWVRFYNDKTAAKDRGEPFTNPGALFMSRLKSIREALSVMPSGASAR